MKLFMGTVTTLEVDVGGDSPEVGSFSSSIEEPLLLASSHNRGNALAKRERSALEGAKIGGIIRVLGMDRLVRTIAFVPARGFYLRYGKRGLDLAIALPALVVLSPLLLALSFLIRLKLGAPVLFRQERVGLDERVFRLIKLRTMTSARDACGHLLPDADRLTPLGLFLRRWSIDELPQLINVIRGDLSLIGPRPLLVRYLPRYTRQQRRRHEVRPGITGWAQVNGRNLLSWRERFEHDVWYVDNCTFPVDLKILVLTVVTFLGRDTTIASGGKDVDEFWGTAGRPVGAPRCEPAEEADGGAQWTRD